MHLLMLVVLLRVFYPTGQLVKPMVFPSWPSDFWDDERYFREPTVCRDR